MRFTISLDDSLAEQFDALIERQGYENRSEACRDLLRERIESERLNENQVRHCVATLSFVYNHHERELASRMADIQHDHHDLCVSTMHVHLDHDNCLETVVLRGLYKEVRAFADRIVAQPGVRHGSINIIPTEVDSPTRAKHRHQHIRPKT